MATISRTPRQGFGYRRIVQLLVFLIILPTVSLLMLGIILIFLRKAQLNLLFGILTVTFVAVVVTGVVLVLVFLRRAVNLSELQADFVSKISHELRTPLTAIRLFAETLERSKDDPATTEKCLRQIASESDRLSRLIERLLDWGRMEAGRKLYALHYEAVDAVVADAVEAFGPERYPELSFSVEVAEGLPTMLADRSAIADALANLLSNARKYGGTPPRVLLRAYQDADGDIAISVRDNGEGIPRGEERRIFEKFYRIDDRLSRTREGSGLGLAIVRHIVTAHGGRVAVASEPGQGSQFTVTLAAVAKSSSAPD
jgi:two-component system, OmpR family, phosphate regulon sensor histidine kinase PhoR